MNDFAMDRHVEALERIEHLESIIRRTKGLLEHAVFDEDDMAMQIKREIRELGLYKLQRLGQECDAVIEH